MITDTGMSHASFGPPEYSTVCIPPVKLDEKERRSKANQILKLLCESPVLQPHLQTLLSAR